MYTARPYIIDNQQMQQQHQHQHQTSEYSNHHSPSASSSHSGGHNQQLYEKLAAASGTVGASNVSSISLLQPLKSFGPQTSNTGASGGFMQSQASSTSKSIPNTPAKYCESSFF